MKDRFDQLKDYIQEHTREVKIGAVTLGGFLSVALLIGLYIYNVESRQVKLVYSPVSACALLTNAEAKELLGDDVIDSNTNKATLSSTRATSKCSYTDKNTNNMAVVAVAVQSAINDQGIQDNKDDFATKLEANPTAQSVTGVGEQAFYTPVNGQLNILKDRAWIIVSYGNTDDISSNSLDNALKVADKILK
jgi:hypothetical protein